MATAKSLLLDAFKNIAPRQFAGYFENDGKFNYFISGNPRLPAAAYVLDYLKTQGKDSRRTYIFSNIEPTNWIRTYFNNVIAIPNPGALDSGAVKRHLPTKDTTRGIQIKGDLTLNAGFRDGAAPLTGGLYAAACKINKGISLSDEERGLQRSLRYYMLACYSLLALEKQLSYAGGNYVAAILVSDKGEILSYGINNGQERASYHHAEVNMLLSYFQRNPNETKFPANSLVFSTLTPCEQCTQYLIDSRHEKSVIFFGQKDQGPSGRAGENIGYALSDETKPLHGCEISKSGIKKIAIDNGLNTCHSGDKSVASKIGKNITSSSILQSSLEAFDHKLHKLGSRGNTDDKIVKDKVLTYLGLWLLTVKL